VNHHLGLFKFPLSKLFKGLFYAREYFTGFKKPDFYFSWMKTLQYETTRVFSEVDRKLPDINVPVWLAHSPYDLAVPYSQMELIAKRINKPDLVNTHTLNQCGHQVFQTRRIYAEPHELALRFLEQMEVKHNES
jgi:pimeloyl-ACP methyl ester carboxylesterase